MGGVRLNPIFPWAQHHGETAVMDGGPAEQTGSGSALQRRLRPPSCIVVCRHPKSASNSSNAKDTRISSCLPYKPLVRSSTTWASACAPSSRVAPKKSEGDRRHLWEPASKSTSEPPSQKTTLRTSIDAKAPVLIGPFSRGGKSRLGKKGADHDFKPWGKLTPFGIFLPDPRI